MPRTPPGRWSGQGTREGEGQWHWKKRAFIRISCGWVQRAQPARVVPGVVLPPICLKGDYQEINDCQCWAEDWHCAEHAGLSGGFGEKLQPLAEQAHYSAASGSASAPASGRTQTAVSWNTAPPAGAAG
jgi:hypothetical protein